MTHFIYNRVENTTTIQKNSSSFRFTLSIDSHTYYYRDSSFQTLVFKTILFEF